MGNLKLKIVLTAVMLVFAIVPAVIVGAIGTFSVMGYERSAKENTLQQVGESKSAGIKQAFKSYSSIVGAIAKSEAAVDVAHGMGSADAELEAAVAADPDILDMMILDDSGTVIEAVNGSEGGVFENLPMNDQGVINMPSVSEMLNWTSYGDAIFVADPIPSDNASGEAGYVVAIVSAGPDSAVMKALSGQFVNLSGASFMIVDKNGVAVNYKQSGSINKEFAGSALQSDIAQFFDTSNSGYSDLKNSKDIKSIKGSASGSTYFVGLAGTDVMNWRWVASADNAAFSKFSTTTNLLGWVVVAASAVVFSIASLLVIGRFLGNMNGMLKTMTEISEADGSTDIRFKVTNRSSELGEIQTSFNELLDEVFLSEERHRTIAELSDNMLFEWDFHKETMYVSDNFKEKFDIDPSEAQLANGKFLDKIMSEDYAEVYKRDISTLLKNRTGHSGEYQMTTKNGSLLWFSIRALCVTDRLGEPLRVIGVVTDIDSEKKLELQLSERASYDFLSQLYNRSTFERELKSEIERSAHSKVAVLFIDVDDFKFINDRFGHSVGDEVIKYVAGCIKQRVKGSGFAGRFGGDEFVLCITDPKQIEEIESLSLDLIDELYEGYHSELANVSINVKASIGIAFYPEHGDDSNKVVAAADEAMYFVKKNGKANYHIYQPEDSEMEDLQHTL